MAPNIWILDIFSIPMVAPNKYKSQILSPIKKFTFLFATLIFGLLAVAQTPQAINYQAVARAADGDPIINQDITAKISILSGSASGTSVYSELHDVVTNSMGLFNLEIGNPDEVLSGNFNDITWGTTNYFLKVEMDENGGTNFVLMGTRKCFRCLMH